MRRVFWVGLVLLLTTACRPTRTPIISTPAPTATSVTPLMTAVVTRSTDQAAFLGAPYVVGMIVAASGEAASLGQPQALTAQLLSQQLATRPLIGVDGIQHPVEVVVMDSRSTPAGATAAWETLLAQGEVVVVVGGSTEAEALALAEQAEAQQVPFMALARSASGAGRSWVFEIAPDPALAWQAPLAYLAAQGVARLCYLDAHPADAPDAMSQQVAALQTAGLSVGLSQTLTPANLDAAQLTTLVTGCQATVIQALPPAGATIVRALRQTTAMPVVTLSPTLCSATFVEQAGPAGEGVMAPCGLAALGDTLPTDTLGGAAAQAYAALYMAASGAPAETAGGYAWDALQATQWALQQLEDGLDMGVRRAEVRQALATPDAPWAEARNRPLLPGRVQAGAWVYWPPQRWTP